MAQTEGSGGSGAGGNWIDLGPLPERIRRLASFWGGSVSGALALYTLASTDGWIQDPEALRAEIRRIQDHRARDELLAWLDGKPS